LRGRSDEEKTGQAVHSRRWKFAAVNEQRKHGRLEALTCDFTSWSGRKVGRRTGDGPGEAADGWQEREFMWNGDGRGREKKLQEGVKGGGI
jgi:hypothetical protein